MKNTTRNALLAGLLALALFALSGCQSAQKSTAVAFLMVPSTDGVADFLDILGDSQLEQDKDVCYNVTPKDITESYGFRIFKFASSCAGFLQYENDVYPLGTWIGGFGVTSFAVADLNADEAFELFFTYSWGSGIHRSNVGYFDSATGEIVPFDFVEWNNDSLLSLDENGFLCVYSANSDVKSFVDMELTAIDKTASIALRDGKITLIEEEQ